MQIKIKKGENKIEMMAIVL